MTMFMLEADQSNKKHFIRSGNKSLGIGFTATFNLCSGSDFAVRIVAQRTFVAKLATNARTSNNNNNYNIVKSVPLLSVSNSWI